MCVVHRKEYRLPVAEGALTTTEPTDEIIKCIIYYRALVKAVELHVDGRMMQGDATQLSRGGWSFKMDEEEGVRAISAALLVARDIDSRTAVKELGQSNQAILRDVDVEEHHLREAALGLPADDVQERLRTQSSTRGS